MSVLRVLEAVTFGVVSPAGKGPNILLAVVYCYIYKSNAKKCSRNWRVRGRTGCESDPESAILQIAKSCFIVYHRQCAWEVRAAQGTLVTAGEGMLEDSLHLVPWHHAGGWL